MNSNCRYTVCADWYSIVLSWVSAIDCISPNNNSHLFQQVFHICTVDIHFILQQNKVTELDKRIMLVWHQLCNCTMACSFYYFACACTILCQLHLHFRLVLSFVKVNTEEGFLSSANVRENLEELQRARIKSSETFMEASKSRFHGSTSRLFDNDASIFSPGSEEVGGSIQSYKGEHFFTHLSFLWHQNIQIALLRYSGITYWL